MSRRGAYTPAPADVLLELLRASDLTYRCHARGASYWVAECPVCQPHASPGARPLVITEHGDRGRVSVRCANGCAGAEILHRLRHSRLCWHCGTDHAAATNLARLAGELLEVACAQQHLVRDILARDGQLEEAVAA